jgi:hypothetical protein
MSDEYYIAKSNELLDKGNYTRIGLAKRLGIARGTLDRIASSGLIPRYPPAMTASQAATYGRKVGGDKWGKKFRLKGSP